MVKNRNKNWALSYGVILLCSGFIAYAQNVKIIPADSHFILEVDNDCGEGVIYSIKPNRLKKQQLEWLNTILRFRYSGERANSIDFEDYAAKRVSIEEMERLLAQPSFSTWAGNDGVKAIKELIAKRRVFLLKKNSLSRDPDLVLKSPVVKSYLESAWALIKVLEKKFGLIEKDNGISCD